MGWDTQNSHPTPVPLPLLPALLHQVLPFDFTDYADAMVRYEASLVEHLVSLGGTDAPPLGGLEAGTSEEWGVPAPGDAPATPHTLDTARLSAATTKFKEAAEAAQAEAQALAAGTQTPPPCRAAATARRA